MPARTADSGLPPVAIRDGQRVLHGARIDAAAVDRGPVPAPPRHDLASAHFKQQLQFFVEKLVVILQPAAEERKRFDERASARHDFRPSVRNAVQRRELLIDAHRVVRGQDGDGARKPDPLRQRRGGRQHDGGRRAGVVGPVMLADAVHVKAGLVGCDDLLHRAAKPLRVADPLARHRVGRRLEEGADADLDAGGLSALLKRGAALFGHDYRLLRYLQCTRAAAVPQIRHTG